MDRHSCAVTSCCSCIKFIIYLNKINLFYTLVVDRHSCAVTSCCSCIKFIIYLNKINLFYTLVVDRHSCAVTSCCSCIKFIIYLNKINSFYTLVVFSFLQPPFAYLFLKTGKPPLRPVAWKIKIMVSGLSEKNVTQRFHTNSCSNFGVYTCWCFCLNCELMTLFTFIW